MVRLLTICLETRDVRQLKEKASRYRAVSRTNLVHV